MALNGGQHTANGSASALSNYMESTFRKLLIVANSGNAAVIYIGPTGVLADGTNAWIALAAGQGYIVQFDNPDHRERWDVDDLYVIGTASDKAHFSQVI